MTLHPLRRLGPALLCALPLILNPGVTCAETLRPPAVPLVACDPYFSIWSPADKLTDADTTHWTGKSHRISSLVRIDGQAFRLMGKSPATVPALDQKSVTVLPTRSIYVFAGQGVELTLTFLTPALPEDLDLLARPVTYLTWDAQATDGKKHALSLYFDAASELAVNEPSQPVTWAKQQFGSLAALSCGSVEQPVLG
ncbi:MAG TPA: DUF5127 domain-containing protein, partial [Candidatus Sulfotelmatobacter sp.]|nr:DUF5127 domain-containing protein [Candidatus Sulfotelmatobacter sp.]